MGKTSLLREVLRRASGFNVLDGGGEEGQHQEPYQLLRQLGVDDVLTSTGAPKNPMAATQALRETVDRLSPTGPVLILVDDLQWVDRQSIESLDWLTRRADGDRLLVALGSRPGESDSDDSWRRLIQRSGAASIVLSGLSLEQASVLVRELDASATDDQVARLRPCHCRSKTPIAFDDAGSARMIRWCSR